MMEPFMIPIVHPIKKENEQAVYVASFQLPYSCHTLYLKIIDNGFMFFRLNADEENNWLWWDGNKHSYHILKKDRFQVLSKWQAEYEMGLVDQFVTLSYQASLVYFKHLSGLEVSKHHED